MHNSYLKKDFNLYLGTWWTPTYLVLKQQIKSELEANKFNPIERHPTYIFLLFYLFAFY